MGLSLLPVLIFLGGLELIDTYRLLRLRRILETVAAGCAVALACYGLNTAVAAWGGVGFDAWARSGAPVVEEAMKALYVFWLIRRGRLGFMVDAAISGFAVGAGFAVVENLFYLPAISATGLAAAAVRGFGTAIMHGGCTAIFGLVSIHRAEIAESQTFRTFAPGLALAILIHLLYNQGFLPPLIATAALLIVLPLMLSLIFWRSEEALKNWVGTKLDKDMDLLNMIATSTFSGSRAGKYLRALENTFDPLVLGDMLCYLQLSLELSAQAKGDLLLREMGFPLTADPELPGRLKELAVALGADGVVLVLAHRGVDRGLAAEQVARERELVEDAVLDVGDEDEVDRIVRGVDEAAIDVLGDLELAGADRVEEEVVGVEHDRREIGDRVLVADGEVLEERLHVDLEVEADVLDLGRQVGELVLAEWNPDKVRLLCARYPLLNRRVPTMIFIEQIRRGY